MSWTLCGPCVETQRFEGIALMRPYRCSKTLGTFARAAMSLVVLPLEAAIGDEPITAEAAAAAVLNPHRMPVRLTFSIVAKCRIEHAAALAELFEQTYRACLGGITPLPVFVPLHLFALRPFQSAFHAVKRSDLRRAARVDGHPPPIALARQQRQRSHALPLAVCRLTVGYGRQTRTDAARSDEPLDEQRQRRSPTPDEHVSSRQQKHVLQQHRARSRAGARRVEVARRQPIRRATSSIRWSVNRRSLATSSAHRFALAAAIASRIAASNAPSGSEPRDPSSKWRMCTLMRSSSSSSHAGTFSLRSANALSKTAPSAACGPRAKSGWAFRPRCRHHGIVWSCVEGRRVHVPSARVLVPELASRSHISGVSMLTTLAGGASAADSITRSPALNRSRPLQSMAEDV
eukprot:scaffold109789_cov75-Phaeocystis_antarctica.AAC.4